MPKVGQINIIGGIGMWENSLQDVMNQVKALGNVDEYLVLINSGGGEVFEGYAIHDYLISLNKPITTRGIGIVASIATVIFLAGSKRQLYPTTSFLIHNPFSGAEGNADDLQKKSDELRVIEDNLISFYIKNTGCDKETLTALMKEDTLVDSDIALELKFATEILEPVKAYATFKKDTMNKGKNTIGKIFKDAFAQLTKLGVVLNETVETIDGKELEITMSGAEPAVGDSVQIDGEPAEGTFILADGTEITVSGGIISEIKNASAEDDKNAKAQLDVLNAKKSELETEIENLKTEIENLKAENASLKNENTAMVEEVTDITNYMKGLKIENVKLPKPSNSFNRNFNPDKEPTKDEVKARLKELAEKRKGNKTKITS